MSIMYILFICLTKPTCIIRKSSSTSIAYTAFSFSPLWFEVLESHLYINSLKNKTRSLSFFLIVTNEDKSGLNYNTNFPLRSLHVSSDTSQILLASFCRLQNSLGQKGLQDISKSSLLLKSPLCNQNIYCDTESTLAFSTFLVMSLFAICNILL